MPLEVIRVPDYKYMYFKLFHATEDAINLLISAQQEAEEIYLSEPEPKMNLIDLKNEDTSPKDSKGPTH